MQRWKAWAYLPPDCRPGRSGDLDWHPTRRGQRSQQQSSKESCGMPGEGAEYGKTGTARIGL